MEVSSTKLAEARHFVASLRADGGTEMLSALRLALQYPPEETHLRQIIFITDGAVGNEEQLFGMIERELGRGRLFTVGIGSAPNSWFMRKAAETGRGTFTTISATSEVSERMDDLFKKIAEPQVTNIKVTWPAGATVDAYPSVVPDLYVDEPVVVKARLTGPLRHGGSVNITGDSANGAWSRVLRLTADPPSAGVGALWARTRIEDLADQGRRGNDADEVRKAIVKTALAHHLVSRHTSLIAVDKTPARSQAQRLRRDQVPNRMAYGQSTNAIFGFPATATNATTLMWRGTLLIMLAALLLLLCRRPMEAGNVAPG